MSEWFENDQFWATMRPYMFSDTGFERAAEQVDGIAQLLDLEPRAGVLDLCCGPGRHALELARRGYGVTAVDRFAPYLDEIRRKDAGIEVVECDMREFRREAAFDAAVNLFTSFGYFEDPEDDLKVLRNVRESLRPGGRFLLDTKGKEVLAWRRRERMWEQHEDGTILLIEEKIIEDWRRTQTTWRLVREGEVHEFHFTLRLYSAAELGASLREAGFGEVAFFGGFDGRPYDNEALRLLGVASA